MYRYIVSILVLAVVLVGCNGSSGSGQNTESAAATDDITPETTELVEDAATEIATESVVPTAAATDDITPESVEAPQSGATEAATAPSIATAQPTDTAPMASLPTAEAGSTAPATEAPLVPNNGDYFISVSYTIDQAEAEEDELMSLLVVASLGNVTLRAIEVSAEDIFLVDANHNRFAPEPANSQTQPPLVDAEVPSDGSFLGLILFRLPAGTVADYLEWCIAGDCDQAIQAAIP